MAVNGKLCHLKKFPSDGRKNSGAQDINMFSLQTLYLLAFVTVTGLSLGKAEDQQFTADNFPLEVASLNELNEKELNDIKNYPYGSTHTDFARDCSEQKGWNQKSPSGLYVIRPKDGPLVLVNCDMSESQNGWTVIQKNSGSDIFNRPWKDYESGFGKPTENHWIGNSNLHYLTKQWIYILRVILTNAHGAVAQADYYGFAVDDKTKDYTVRLGYFRGNSTDALNDNVKFATFDRDTRSGCASSQGGGWWYANCGKSVLNNKQITWDKFCNGDCRSVIMQVRPICQDPKLEIQNLK